MYVTFYKYDKIEEIYKGNMLQVDPSGRILLDDVHIATDTRCYECRYFIAEKDYNVPNYTPDSARWLTQMTVSMRKPIQLKPKSLPARKRAKARCQKCNSLIKTLNEDPYTRGCPKCTKELMIDRTR